MELNFGDGVFLGVLIGFLLPVFWMTLLWVYEVLIRHRNRMETMRIPIEQDEDQGKRGLNKIPDYLVGREIEKQLMGSLLRTD